MVENLRFRGLVIVMLASGVCPASSASVVAASCRLDHLRLRLHHLRNDYLDETDERAPGRRAIPEALPPDSVRPA